MRSALAFLCLMSIVVNARAQGVIVRPDWQPAHVVLEDHRVDASLEENLATVSVEHVFKNDGKATAEGTFLFPLPPGAHVTRFVMDVDGKEMAGELLTAEEARKIYEEIVRKSLDPALLEMTGHRSFRAGIFPIPPGEKRTIRLRYDAELPQEGNTISFLYPMRGSIHTRSAGWPQPRIMPLDEELSGPNAPADATNVRATRGAANPAGVMATSSAFSADRTDDVARTHIRLAMRSSTPILTVYSPSHDVEVERDGDHRAILSYEGDLRPEAHDFVAYFGIEERELGATLLTHRPYSDKPGYFMLLLSPRVEIAHDRVQSKDVVLVLDTSGSMAGAKMEQAREAVKYCLNRLGEHDRFGLVAFSSDVDRFRDALLPATSRNDALFFVDQLEASGGTNIHDALLSAAEMIADNERGMIIFLTDGLPSSGVTDEGDIRRAAAAALDDRARVFSFGVGHDVNTRLLDGLSRETGAPADYIAPDENIEERVSTFYEKVRHPLLTDLTFEIEGADAYAFAPNSLTDLYKGSQLIVAGRYRRPGAARLTLSGLQDGSRVAFEYDLEFAGDVPDRAFVGRLWATRRVGGLLDEVRMNGETDALKEEIIALAKEFGLVTPYTSYLVQEDESMADNIRLHPQRDRAVAQDLVMSQGAQAFRSQSSSGASAVAASKAIHAMEAAEVVSAPSGRAIRTVGGRIMQRSASGAWIDADYEDEDAVIVEIKMASDAYFALLSAYPQALPFAQLGRDVTFKLGTGYVRIGTEGLEHASAEELHLMVGEITEE